ncbi:MAG: MFS transporter [Lautropia sp.]
MRTTPGNAPTAAAPAPTPDSHDDRPPARRYALPSICFALFAAATSMSCVFAILPAVGRGLGLSETRLGWVVAPAALVFVLFGPVWGLFGQRWTARTILTAALVMIGACTLLFGYAMAWRLDGRIEPGACFALLLASRLLLSPFAAALLPTAQSYIAGTTEGASRTRALAGMGASFALGMVVAPGLAAAASSAGLLMPFYIVASLLLIAAGGTWSLLPGFTPKTQRWPEALQPPESRRQPESQRPPQVRRPLQASAAQAGDRTAWSTLWQPLGILVLLYTVYGILMQVTGFRMQDQFHLDARQATQHAGAALMAAAAALVAAQLVLSRMAIPELPAQRRIVLAAGAFGLLGLASLIGTPAFVRQLAGMALFGLCLGVFMPFILSLLTLRAQQAGDQARIGGFSGGAQGLGMVIGPLLGAWGYRIQAQVPYWIAVALLCLVCMLYADATRPRAADAAQQDGG